MKQFLKFEKQRNAAAEKLRRALAAKWPVGSHAEVILNSRQRTPSPGEVVHHSGTDGVVAVRLFKESGWHNKRHIARVHFSRVVQS